MGNLSPWQDLPAGGTVVAAEVEQPRTGGGRTGLRPVVEL